MQKQSIFGITPSEVNKKFDNLFEVVYDDANFVAQSRQTFHHDDDDLHFDYKYMVTINDTREYDADHDGRFVLTLSLFPAKTSLSEKNLKAMCDCCGVDEADVNAMEYNNYGFVIPFGVDEIDIPDGYDKPLSKDSRLDLVANVFETMDSMRGYYLDKSLNLIGTTGWDVLDNAINDISLI